MTGSKTASAPRLLSRTAFGAPDRPLRIVHLGLGAFHRSHQAAYTDRCDPDRQWGIAAFSGRSAGIAERLARQDGLFTLVERSADRDDAQVVQSIVEAHDGADLKRLTELIATPGVAIVTLTITEAGYRLDAAGALDLADAAVRADAEVLAGAQRWVDDSSRPAPVTALGRLVLGLEARRRSGAGPIAVVPCDNLPSNGELTRRATLTMAAHVGADLVEWMHSNVSFVSTSVDRITPRAGNDVGETVRTLTGWTDECPVVAEPFSDWVLCGAFPAGRPHWEDAGARFVDDIAPFERRKLRMLNGAHTLMATAGRWLGHTTVADAVADPRCLQWIEEYWDEAAQHLAGADLDLDGYRPRLIERFRNWRIEHRLDQIAEDSATKIRVRILPTVRAARTRGDSAPACARIVAGWIANHERGNARGSPADRVGALDEALGDDAGFVDSVQRALAELQSVPLRQEISPKGQRR